MTTYLLLPVLIICGSTSVRMAELKQVVMKWTAI